MNGWDLFTWIMAIVLGFGSLTVFGFFLKDVGKVWRGEVDRDDEEPRP